MKNAIQLICIILSLVLLVCNGMVGCSSSSASKLLPFGNADIAYCIQLIKGGSYETAII